MTFSHAVSTNNYGPAKFIVSSSAANGTHTTIAAAITSASSGDTIFIRPGTYTENLTLKAGVNLTAFECDGSLNGSGNVIIVGKCTFTAAGSVTISSIQLQTNSDFLLAVTGIAASIVNLNNCYLNCTNNTGISYTSSSASSAVNFQMCSGDITTTGIALFSASGSGSLGFIHCKITASGNSVTASTSSAGSIYAYWSEVNTPFSISSAGTVTLLWAFISLANATAVTTAGTGAHVIHLCWLTCGTASCVSIGAGTIVSITSSTMSSSNANVLTGAGTLTYSVIAFGGSSSGHNVTTETALGSLL